VSGSPVKEAHMTEEERATLRAERFVLTLSYMFGVFTV